MPPDPHDFFVGINLPWLAYGCDFGANAWQPGGGVAAPERQRRLDEIFGRLSASGLTAVRWFVLCDGRAGLVFDPAGTLPGLDSFFFRDLDAALAAAARHRLSLTLVLFDFLWCGRRRLVNGVVLGGRRALLAHPARRACVLDHVIRPILTRYGDEPTIAAWDVFNEPEWATLGYGSVNPLTSLLPRSMQTLIRDIVALVHAETRQQATVGLASFRGLRLLKGIDLDLYQVHWYDRRSRFLAEMTGGWRGKPLLLGEFPTKGSARNPLEIVEGARARGYCGALAWSALAPDEHSELEAIEQAVRSWRA